MRLVLQRYQGFLERRPAEDIDPHGRQVALGLGRFLLEFRDLSVLVCDHDPEPAGLLNGHRHGRDGHVRLMFLVIIQHHFIIHLIDMVAGEDQHVIRMEGLHIVQILVNGVGRACVPLTVAALLIRRQDRHASDIPVQIPGNPDSDMAVQTQGLILGQHTHGIDSRIDTVAEREVNDPVLSSKRNRRLCHFRRKNTKPAALSPCKQHRYHFFFYHVITPSRVVDFIYYNTEIHFRE